MAELPGISFTKSAGRPAGTIVAFTDSNLALGPVARDLAIAPVLAKAARAAGYKGKLRSVLDVLAPGLEGVDRLVVVGLGDLDKRAADDWLKLGGDVFGAMARGRDATTLFERPDGKAVGEAADVALGAALRSYSFEKYKSQKPEEDEPDPRKKP